MRVRRLRVLSDSRSRISTMRLIFSVLTAALLLVFTSPTLISAQTQSGRPSVALTVWTLDVGAATYVSFSTTNYSRQTTCFFFFPPHLTLPGLRFLGMGV